MNLLLKRIEDSQNSLQTKMEDKLKNGGFLTDAELDSYRLTTDDQKMMDIFKRVSDGENVPGFDMNDFLASPSARVLLPKVIIGTARRAADPVYLASKFFKKVKIKNGVAMQFPEFGVMRAYDVPEGAEIPAESIDWQTNSNSMIKVGKSGVRIEYSKELFDDCEFDLVSMLTSEAGRAMARHKEQKCYTEWLSNGWTVFDNNLYKTDPVRYASARTGGLDFEGNFNGTMSVENYLELIIALYNNGFSCTDLIMNPLAWLSFANAGLTGGLSAPFDKEAKRESTNKTFQIGPNSIQGRIPFTFNVNLSAFAPIDREAKTFDMFAVDANNVGLLLEKDALKTDEFKDPARDLLNIKLVERYGLALKHQGRACCSAKGISMAKSYPTPERIHVINK